MRPDLTQKPELSDAELLAFVLKDVKPLPGRTIKTNIKQNVNIIKPTPENLIQNNLSNNKIKNKAPLPQRLNENTSGLEKNSARRMKRGKIHIDARLDLHGYYQEEAYNIMSDFISNSAQLKRRCVLIITGKGLHFERSGEKRSGVLRKMVPIWLNEEPNRSQILSFSQARPFDGGSGALYVLLKRQRAGSIA